MKTNTLRMSLFVVFLFTLSVNGCRGKSTNTTTTHAEERLSATLRTRLKEALTHYESIRSALAQDRMEGIPEAARSMIPLLEEEPETELETLLEAAKRALAKLAASENLDQARLAFAEVSQPIIALVTQSAELSGTRYRFECPMVEGFNEWIQASPEIDNPYMGKRMPKCGNSLPWPKPADLSQSTAAGDGEIAYYTCPMHPSIRSEEPGNCPICGMTLVPVTQEELRTGTITVDSERRQLIGVRVAPVAMKDVRKTLRAAGRIAYDETRLAEVTLKVGGWIETLYADATGMKVNRGAPLFTLYSPELFAAQGEYLAALRSQATAQSTPAPDRADYLVEAARNRLRLLDVTEMQLDRIAASGEPIKNFPFLSPVTGYVIEKNVVAGASVEPKMVLYRIADLDRVWIEAEFYTAEIELVKTGAQAIVTLPYLPGQQVAGKVSYIYPYLDPSSRTGRVRIELQNPGLELKPDMYVNVEIEVLLGPRLVVPKSAVLPAGERQFVFLDLGEGKLRPQRVVLGVEAGDQVEVVSGLKQGDPIVVSGNFLIAAESRLKTALEQW